MNADHHIFVKCAYPRQTRKGALQTAAVTNFARANGTWSQQRGHKHHTHHVGPDEWGNYNLRCRAHGESLRIGQAKMDAILDLLASHGQSAVTIQFLNQAASRMRE